MQSKSGYLGIDAFDDFLEVHRTKLDHKAILGYEETRDVFPRFFLDEPTETLEERPLDPDPRGLSAVREA